MMEKTILDISIQMARQADEDSHMDLETALSLNPGDVVQLRRGLAHSFPGEPDWYEYKINTDYEVVKIKGPSEEVWGAYCKILITDGVKEIDCLYNCLKPMVKRKLKVG